MRTKTVPVSLVINDKKALVIGGGNVALQKVHWLQKLGVPVDVLATSICDELRQLENASDVHLREGRYDGQAAGYALVIGATDDPQVNRAIYLAATQVSVPVNIVDDPALCTFFVPATVVRGPLKVAVASDGVSPALCARLRREFEGLLPGIFEEYLVLLEGARERVGGAVSDEHRRVRVLKELASAKSARIVADAGEAVRDQRFNELVEQLIAEAPRPGTVYLVGAGPGDPGLFTIRGLQALMGADAVLHDGLANPLLMENLPQDVEIHDCSKRAGCAFSTQSQINELMEALARKGMNVCRLKGGDPCVFGRGGDEALYLAQRHIPFQIVSGVASPIAVPAYAGIPITHRDHASYFQVVTGHEDPTKTESRVNWDALGAGGGTVVFLMGAGRLSEIAQKLMSHGRARQTPLAVISKGTLPGQRVFETTLARAADNSLEIISQCEKPALIVVGDVVALRKELDWFDGNLEQS